MEKTDAQDVAPSSEVSSDLNATTGHPEIDPVAERKLVKKLDWVLLPLFTAICALG